MTSSTTLSSGILSRPLRRRLTELEFCRFYEEDGAALRAYIVRVAGNNTRGEDLFQETCYRLLRGKLPEMDSLQLKAYAYRTATRLIYDSWRKAGRVRDEEQKERQAPDPENELRHDIQRLFSRLKTRQRTLLWLAYVEGCDHREIAERLGLRPGSIRVLLFRARKKFAAILEREGLRLEDLK